MKQDIFTFRAVIETKTQQGAYLIRDTSGHRSFVPVRSVIVEPEAFTLGRQEVSVSLSRSLARARGFLREGGPGQGSLL